MLARRASAFARSFATVVDNAGVKVAAVDNGQATTAVTFLVKAGSRYEPKPGVAHTLKNFAFKSTAKRSALGTVRESELYGGVLSASLSREYLALTSEFLRGDESFFVDLISSFLTSGKYQRHEFQEYVLPVVEAESTAASQNPATHALELAHSLAFRSGLGSSLFASPHSHVSLDDVKEFAARAFSKGNIAVLGTGIDSAALTQLVEKALAGASVGDMVVEKPSTYFGGETRVESHGGPETVFIGFGAAGPADPALAILSAHLSPQPSVKWSQGLSPISAAIPQGTSVQTVLMPYSDATLFGLLIQGSSAEGVKEAAKVATKALKESTGLKGDALKTAVAKAKFAAASSLDSRDGIFGALSTKVFANSNPSIEATLASIDKVDAAVFSKSITAITKAKPTFVAIGSVQALPFADEVGL
ncbi:Metalloenzyme, LuxS/M16 peptidase-like protein [Suillus clintonianus]|uniref:Metalloenzyme, LuxS/M16 peptidase-like protein n=1 Tax=Suillus clintonianus TaxID=1904413 RepID=UPI001B85CB20|nr:Metalloenzyme, LuxS/M16 peptidase-like protein [Suillus clintonianus]KAG2117716.1 Metalloenzyme, LuxS/M16 peptidase-like protein [Suillus clintonianus]